MNNQDQQAANQNTTTFNTSSAILQPEDSKRVADALIEKINDANFDIANAMAVELFRALHEGLTCGLGDAIVSVIERQVGCAVESCVGSEEMMCAVSGAIRDGIAERKNI